MIDSSSSFLHDAGMTSTISHKAFERLMISLAYAVCGFVCLLQVQLEAQSRIEFLKTIQPIFNHACIDCHGEETQKGGLRLDGLEHLALGGSSGAAIVPGNRIEGTLLSKILHTDPEERMPPEKRTPLRSEEIQKISSWIVSGAMELVQLEKAPYPQEAYDHWSLRPLVKPATPELDAVGKRWVRHSIDAFIFNKLQEQGLSPSIEANRSTLIRRVYYDLTGLPPSPQEVHAFVNDSDPGSYEQLVDRLLGSEAYGERWARHWLDVVHYADTHGYDKDKPRPNAWPYRDYVIRSFNEDKPYSRFVEEQIAGDVLYPESVDGLTGTGFIATGPWDFIGHAEVSEDKLDGKVARHLDRDDMVTVTMNTFTSTTVQCARCHHHKFDPVRMEDYYRLQSVFAALDRADRTFDADADVAEKRREWTSAKSNLEQELKELDNRIREAAGPALNVLDGAIQKLEAGQAQKPEAYGYHSAISQKPDDIKWVQVDLGEVVSVSKVTLRAADDDFNGIGAGFGFPRRFKIEASSDPAFEKETVLLVNQTHEDVINPATAPVIFEVAALPVRYIRVTATRLAARSNDFIFALAELEVMNSQGDNLAFGGEVSAKDSIEASPRWGKVNLTDGKFVSDGKVDAEGKSLAQLKSERDLLIEKVTLPEWTHRQRQLEQEIKDRQSKLEQLPPASKVYAGTIHQGGGAFRGTGHQGGKPRAIHVLARGDVAQPGREVGPGAIPVIYGKDPRFNLSLDHNEGDRRVALAQWILQKDHPLTWRSVVNRIWQYHFGAGICDTPNDFGLMGSAPTHPELLDWLSVTFRDGGQSFKQLHRMILTSSTYRQSSQVDPVKAALDSGNRFLWRMNPRRLEAEAIRDSVLSVAGVLDSRVGGPAFMDFVIEKPEHSPHYQYHLHDPMDPKSHRRSVYRFIVRSQQQPFMTTLDCADPSLMVGKRNETLTPSQSLALLNNPFMVAMAEVWAKKLQRGGPDLSHQIKTALEEITGKLSDHAEIYRWTTYAQKHGLANTCRWMLNMNAFLFVD